MSATGSMSSSCPERWISVSPSVTVDRQQRWADGQWAETTIARQVETDLDEAPWSSAGIEARLDTEAELKTTSREGRRTGLQAGPIVARSLAMSRYNFRESEAKWQRIWREKRLFEVAAAPGAQNIMLSKCSHTRPAVYMSGMCGTTRFATRRPLSPLARLQCSASDGVGRLRTAGGECGNRRQGASRRAGRATISP